MLHIDRHHAQSTRTLTRTLSHTAACALLVAGLSACADDDKKGRQPLGDAGAAANASSSGTGETGNPALPLAALNALEEGNVAYRAKQLDVALVKYREAALAAPAHAAPWFGIYMAANELKNTQLADSAMAQVKLLSANPAALDAHATVTSPTGGLNAAEGGMPAGHPTTKVQLPAGHPAPAPTDSTKRTRM